MDGSAELFFFCLNCSFICIFCHNWIFWTKERLSPRFTALVFRNAACWSVWKCCCSVVTVFYVMDVEQTAQLVSPKKTSTAVWIAAVWWGTSLCLRNKNKDFVWVFDHVQLCCFLSGTIFQQMDREIFTFGVMTSVVLWYKIKKGEIKSTKK